MQTLMLAILAILPDVTKEDIKKLLDAKMREETILKFIERNRPAKELSSDDVVELKKRGATDKVIEALLTAKSAPPPEPEVREEVRVVRPQYYVYDYYPSYSYSYWHYGYPRHYYSSSPYSYRYRPHAHTYTRPERSFRSYLK